jgi:hypothetical protein
MKHNMTFSDLMSQRQAAGTLQHQHRDHETLNRASQCNPITSSRPHDKLTFDRLSSLFI